MSRDSHTTPDDLPVEVDPIYGCWLWVGTLDRAGYPRKWVGRGQTVLAHRHTYETLVGPIPGGQELDHVCRRRQCVRPEHIEPVTRRENVRRLQWAYRAKLRCPAGHGRNDLLRTPEGGFVCRICSGLKTSATPPSLAGGHAES